MLKSVKGVYRDGRVELFESLPEGIEREVIVTFLDPDPIDLPARGVDERQAADLRFRLRAFAEDWERPEMDRYDAVSPRRHRPRAVPRLEPAP